MVVDRRLREADLKRHVAHRNACIPVAGEKPQRDFKENVRMKGVGGREEGDDGAPDHDDGRGGLGAGRVLDGARADDEGGGERDDDAEQHVHELDARRKACGRELQHDARKGAREAKDGRHAHEVEARRGGVLVKRQDEHDGDREAEAHEHHQKAGEKGGTLHVE